MRCISLCISIHAPREGGDWFDSGSRIHFKISIHAPREGGDGTKVTGYNVFTTISIHAPREGGDAVPVIQPEPM